MNYLKCLFLIFITAIFLSSCGSDEDCSADAWVGEWSGISMCDDGSSESVTVRVTKKDENTVVYSSAGQDYEVVISGCSFSIAESIETIFGPVDIDLNSSIDGNRMKLMTVAMILGQEVECNISLSK